MAISRIVSKARFREYEKPDTFLNEWNRPLALRAEVVFDETVFGFILEME